MRRQFCRRALGSTDRDILTAREISPRLPDFALFYLTILPFYATRIADMGSQCKEPQRSPGGEAGQVARPFHRRTLRRKHTKNEGTSGYMYENTCQSKNVICKMVIRSRQRTSSPHLRARRRAKPRRVGCGNAGRERDIANMKAHPAMCMKTRTSQKMASANWLSGRVGTPGAGWHVASPCALVAVRPAGLISKLRWPPLRHCRPEAQRYIPIRTVWNGLSTTR